MFPINLPPRVLLVCLWLTLSYFIFWKKFFYLKPRNSIKEVPDMEFPAEAQLSIQGTSFYAFVFLYLKYLWRTISNKNAIVQQGERENAWAASGKETGLELGNRGWGSVNKVKAWAELQEILGIPGFPQRVGQGEGKNKQLGWSVHHNYSFSGRIQSTVSQKCPQGEDPEFILQCGKCSGWLHTMPVYLQDRVNICGKDSCRFWGCVKSTLANNHQSHIQNTMHLRDGALKVLFSRPRSKQIHLFLVSPQASVAEPCCQLSGLQIWKRSHARWFLGRGWKCASLCSEMLEKNPPLIDNKISTQTPGQKKPFHPCERFGHSRLSFCRPFWSLRSDSAAATLH